MRDSNVALRPLLNEYSGAYIPSPHHPSTHGDSLDEHNFIDAVNSSRRYLRSTPLKHLPLHRISVSRALWRLAILIPFLAFAAFGVIHILEALIGRSRALWNLETCDLPALSKLDWSKLGSFDPSRGRGNTRDVIPIPCHSHNDYSRSEPLFEALRYGLTSVEADIWRFEDELLVGHDGSQLNWNSTLSSMYLDPLKRLLDGRNRPTQFTDGSIFGVFETDPDQTLVLLVDFKQPDEEAFNLLKQQLQPLRDADYLSHWDGEAMNLKPITVVCSGDAPFERIAEASGHRDIFYDAPLHNVSLSVHNVSNSYYASTNFRASVGQVWLGHLLPHQSAVIRAQIRQAKAAGLKARYWGTPAWPVSLRQHIWHVLMKEGADVLNVDDLRAAAAFYW